MAVIETCGQCGQMFGTSASGGKWLCDECDGTNARKQAEEDRWNGLSADEKLNELRNAILALQQHQQWDGRIG